MADDGTHGRELWKTDGTPAGTVLVQDIQSGSVRSSPQGLTNINGTVFFSADDGINGRELWKSDGTAAGTVMVKDLYAGTRWDSTSYSYTINSSAPQNLTDVNGTLFFTADDGSNGRELWASDGTAAGTMLIKDMNAGSTWDDESSSYAPNSSGPAELDRRRRQAVLHGRRRLQRPRAVDERRHGRRDRAGQRPVRRYDLGLDIFQHNGKFVKPAEPNGCQRHAILCGQRRSRWRRNSGNRTARPLAQSWSRTLRRARRLLSPTTVR